MRSAIVRRYKTVHTWAGIGTGLLLFIAFYAGAITMFAQPLRHWLAPPERPQALAHGSLADAQTLIEQTLRARPQAAKAFTLLLGDAANAAPRLSWQQGGKDDASWSARLAADGRVRIEQEPASALPGLIDRIHRTAGIPGGGEFGEQVMGIASLVYALALVSGVIVLLPSLVKDFFALRVARSAKRVWLDAHNVVGIVSLPFHLFMALSAIVFGLHDHLYDIQDVLVYGGQLRPIMRAGNPGSFNAGGSESAVMLPPAALLARVREIAPTFAPQALYYRAANTSRASVRVAGSDPRYLVRGSGFALLDAQRGELISGEYLPGQQSAWSAIVSAFFALHFGSFGGAPVRWSYFFLGLAGAFLFYSGNLLWIETRRRKQASERGAPTQDRAARVLAAATVGVALGCIAGISLAIVAGKLIFGQVANLAAWQLGIYYALLIGSVGWAALRGAARAAVELLWLASAATLAIPLSSLLALVAPSLGLWAHGGDAAGVDLVAACGGLGLVALSRATRRRTISGRSDSVWSAR